MPEIVEDRIFFHVASTMDYNRNPPLTDGYEFIVGDTHNPFFGFYEGEITIPINTQTGVIPVKALRFLREVSRGNITPAPDFVHRAHHIAQHYLMLARELIMEEVRKEIQPEAPSRQSCLWVVESLDEARHWKQRIQNPQTQIVELTLNGIIQRVDAALLLGDSEPLTVTYDRARQYWRGNISTTPELEVLFKGQVRVNRTNII